MPSRVTLQRTVLAALALAAAHVPSLVAQSDSLTARAIVSLTRIGDHELRSAGFTLRRPLEVRVYALGEGSDPGGEMSDYAWILNIATRRSVWVMRYGETGAAGGAEKNRLFDGTIHLDAGTYLVYYRSDGSHSYGHWNAAAPADSEHWGVSVFPAGGRLTAAAVAPFRRTSSSAIAEIVRVKSNKHKREIFTLDRPTAVHVRAIGEAADGHMVDYGWIQEIATGNTVWAMSFDSTTAAGGAEKNRLFDGTITLAAGRYVLNFETDGSHAYDDWNDGPPDDPEGWGITLTRVP